MRTHGHTDEWVRTASLKQFVKVVLCAGRHRAKFGDVQRSPERVICHNSNEHAIRERPQLTSGVGV
jgi:hypothetical protein